MNTKLFALASLVVSGLAGCVGTLKVNPEWVIEGPTGAPAAIQLAQERMGGDSWLPVVWYGQAALASCPGTDGSFQSDQDFQGPEGCTSGITGDNVSIVGWEGTNHVAWTAVIHELAHQRFGDPGHADPHVWGDHGRDNVVAGTIVGDISLELLNAPSPIDQI